VCSRPDRIRRGSICAAAVLLALILSVLALPAGHAAGLVRLALDVRALSHPAFSVEDIRLRLDAQGAVGALHIGRVRAGGSEWRALELRCGGVGADAGVLACKDASVHVAGRRLALELDLESALGAGPLHVVLRLARGGRIEAHIDAAGGVRVQLRALSAADIAAVAGPWLPEVGKVMRSYKPSGAVDGELEWSAGAGE
jgi:hypothetical protein